MAIIKLGSTVVGVRGSIGGVTFSGNLGGPYAKAWGRSTNPRAVRQQNARASLGNLGAIWQGMTDTERAAWDTFAATDPEPTFNSLGEPVVLSGYGYFARCNVRRVKVGMDVSITPPSGGDAVQPTTPLVTAFTVQVVTPQIEVNWFPISSPVGALIVLFLVVLPTGGTVYNPQRLSYISNYTANDSSWNPYAAYEAVFGLTQIGWGVAGRLYTQNVGGLRSAPAELLTRINF